MNLKNLSKTAPLFAALVLAGCSIGPGWNTVAGNGQIVSQAREVSRFNEVSVSGAGELTVVQGNEESLLIETDENLLPLIKSEVSNGHLWIGPKDVNLRPSRTIRYEVTLKDLNALGLSGSIRAQLGRIKTENLALHVSGSGTIRLDHLEARKISANISGSGSTAVAGQVERQNIHISGSGSYRASDLTCSQGDAQISGSGSATLRVKDTLNAHLSGSGGIDYYGNPQVTRSVSGSGRIRQAGTL